MTEAKTMKKLTAEQLHFIRTDSITRIIMTADEVSTKDISIMVRMLVNYLQECTEADE